MGVGFALHFVPAGVIEDLQQRLTDTPLIVQAACIVAVIVIVIQTKSAGVQPFIYFQF